MAPKWVEESADRKIVSMIGLLVAVVWTFWIAVVLAVSAIGLVLTVVVLYLMKVVALRYPGR